jgi:hypothetical protein
MYSPAQVWRGIRHPERAALEAWRVYNRRLRGRTGIEVMDADWDTLVILDACRYDLFAEVNNIEGELRSVVSQGSNTAEFLEENFDDGPYLDTVYVSANPQTRYNDIDSEFVHTERPWEDDWDEELRTVTPETVTDRALDVHEEFPDKRLIVHYIQPHYPFIGEAGREIEHGSVVEVTTEGEQKRKRDVPSVWERLEAGKLDRNLVWQAYQENLDLVLPAVQRLLANLDGRSVVTSDHGNAFGRYDIYGHPRGRYLVELVRVPWLSINSNERRQISDGCRRSTEIADKGIISERLTELGYTD